MVFFMGDYVQSSSISWYDSTSIFLSSQRARTSSPDSQGNSQARPQLEDSLRGTGTTFAGISFFLQVRSKRSAMLVTSKVAMQRIFFTVLSPGEGRFPGMPIFLSSAVPFFDTRKVYSWNGISFRRWMG